MLQCARSSPKTPMSKPEQLPDTPDVSEDTKERLVGADFMIEAVRSLSAFAYKHGHGFIGFDVARGLETEVAWRDERMAELEALLSQSTTDTQRLDWIEQVVGTRQPCTEVFFAGLRYAVDQNASSYQTEIAPTGDVGRSYPGDTLRASIDAAMAAASLDSPEGANG